MALGGGLYNSMYTAHNQLPTCIHVCIYIYIYIDIDKDIDIDMQQRCHPNYCKDPT